jgi:hypothetical protein
MSANTFLPPSPVVPGFLLITAITRAYPMVVTITDSIYNTYIVGQSVHLSIPAAYGMLQADQLTAEIIAIDGFDFSLNVNSSGFDAFVVPNPSDIPTPVQPATLAPAGCKNIYNTTQEPFHSLSNQGN